MYFCECWSLKFICIIFFLLPIKLLTCCSSAVFCLLPQPQFALENQMVPVLAAWIESHKRCSWDVESVPPPRLSCTKVIRLRMKYNCHKLVIFGYICATILFDLTHFVCLYPLINYIIALNSQHWRPDALRAIAVAAILLKSECKTRKLAFAAQISEAVLRVLQCAPLKSRPDLRILNSVIHSNFRQWGLVFNLLYKWNLCRWVCVCVCACPSASTQSWEFQHFHHFQSFPVSAQLSVSATISVWT